ncbi:MAG: protein-glutamate methylesterase/protein-glutamine glutaminase [bacterium]
MEHDKLFRILVVDDTRFYRMLLTDVLSEIPGVRVEGEAENGKVALAKIEELKPDLITLDIEMPEADGLETLQQLKNKGIQCPVIMVSSLTKAGATVTMQALELGAVDFITKPFGTDFKGNKANLALQLKPRINAFITKKIVSSITQRSKKKLIPQRKSSHFISSDIHENSKKNKIIVIGISTGGPNALAKVIPDLPEDLGIPVIIVQHMPQDFTAAFANSLNQKSAITVLEGKSGQKLTPGCVYLAPGGKQMKVGRVKGSDDTILRVTDDPPENFCKPSVDYLFRSIAQCYEERALGIIMTGMGSDGTAGARLMKTRGAKIFVQDEESCVIFGMPKMAIEAGAVDAVIPLDKIAEQIIKFAR